MVAVKDLLINTGSSFALEQEVPQTSPFSVLGQGVTGAGQILEKKKVRETENFINEKLYEFQNQQIEKFKEKQLSHDNIDTFTDEVSSGITNDASVLIDEASISPFIDERKVRQATNRVKANLVNRSINFESQEKSRLSALAREKAADNVISGALLTGEYDIANEELDFIVEQERANSSPSELADFRNRVKGKLVNAKILNGINSNPDSIDDLIGEHEGELTPESIVTFQKQAEQRSKMIRLEYERNLKNRQNLARFDFFARISENPNDVSNEDIIDAVSDNTLDPDDGEALIKLKTTDVNVKNDLGALASLDNRLAIGDLTTQEIIKEHSENRITQETAQRYIQQVNSGIFSTPAGKQAQQLLEAGYKKDAFGVMSLVDQESLAEDKFELFTRSTNAQNPENPILVAREIRDRNRAARKIELQNARMVLDFKDNNPDIMTIEDANRLEIQLMNKRKNGKITKEDFEKQFNAIRLFKDTLE